MNARYLIFRFRSWALLLIYLLGFFAPWKRFFPSGGTGAVWLAASTLPARAGWMSLPAATAAVTIAAICCCALGAFLRVWARAYLGADATMDACLHGSRMVAAGPYRHLRNPLYLGSWLFALGVSILMPPSGAIVFLAALSLLQLGLIFGEERFLLARLGPAYREYCRRVRRVPSIFPAGSRAPSGRPHWLRAILAEIYFVGFTLCFLAFAWRYNRWLLIRCLLICYGLALIAFAFSAPRDSPAGDR